MLFNQVIQAVCTIALPLVVLNFVVFHVRAILIRRRANLFFERIKKDYPQIAAREGPLCLRFPSGYASELGQLLESIPMLGRFYSAFGASYGLAGHLYLKNCKYRELEDAELVETGDALRRQEYSNLLTAIVVHVSCCIFALVAGVILVHLGA